MAIVDLSIYAEETLDIKLLDGRVLSLPKPSERVLLMLTGLRSVTNDSAKNDPEATILAIIKCVKNILNTNKQGYIITEEEVHNIPFNLLTVIVKEYSEFSQRLIGAATKNS